KGELLTLIGSQNSESGGNSMAPPSMIDPANRPTKIDRVSDVKGLVDSGDVRILNTFDTVRVLETQYKLSERKVNRASVNTGLTSDADVKRRFKCAYLKTADTVETF